MELFSCPQLNLISLGFHFVLMLAHRENETVCRQTCDEWFISYAMWHSTPSCKRAYVCETNSGCWPHLTSTRLNMRGDQHEGDSPAKKAYGRSNWELIRLIVISSASPGCTETDISYCWLCCAIGKLAGKATAFRLLSWWLHFCSE